MKEKKMLMGIAFAICMAISVYAGGAKQNAAGGQSNYKGNLAFVTLKYYNIGDKAPAMDAVLSKMNETLRDQLNCELAVEYLPWDGLEQKYQLVFASGEDFDAIYAADWNFYSAVATKNGYKELTPDFIKQYAPYVASQIPEVGWNQVRINGKIYMIPQTVREYNHYLLTIRGDLREKYGLPPIETYDDLERYMSAAKRNNPELMPISLGMINNIANWIELWNLMHDRFGIGGFTTNLFYYDVNNPRPRVVNYLEQSDAAEFIAMMNRWQKAGFWSRSILSSTQDSYTDFTNGIAAAAIGNGGTMNWAYRQDQTNNNGAWKVELYDFTAKANKKVPAYPYSSGGIALNRNAKNPERVLMMVDMFRREKELNRLVQNGIRGIHWDYEADGETLKSLPVGNENSYGDAFTWGPFRNVNFTVPYGKEDSPDYRRIFDNSVIRELTTPATGFLFNDSNVKNEIAAVSDVYQQYVLPLILGFSDPSELPGVIQRLKTAGIDRIIAEMQKQLDANR